MQILDKLLDTAKAGELRPTQITVGLREVKAKRRAWQQRGEDAARFLGRHLATIGRRA